MKLLEIKSVDELTKIRKIINIIIDLLNENINNFKDGKTIEDEKQKELLSFLIGNRESVVSIITKLSNLLIKVSNPKEEKLGNYKIDSEDLEIIKKYISENSER